MCMSLLLLHSTFLVTALLVNSYVSDNFSPGGSDLLKKKSLPEFHSDTCQLACELNHLKHTLAWLKQAEVWEGLGTVH